MSGSPRRSPPVERAGRSARPSATRRSRRARRAAARSAPRGRASRRGAPRRAPRASVAAISAPSSSSIACSSIACASARYLLQLLGQVVAPDPRATRPRAVEERLASRSLIARSSSRIRALPARPRRRRAPATLASNSYEAGSSASYQNGAQPASPACPAGAREEQEAESAGGHHPSLTRGRVAPRASRQLADGRSCPSVSARCSSVAPARAGVARDAGRVRAGRAPAPRSSARRSGTSSAGPDGVGHDRSAVDGTTGLFPQRGALKASTPPERLEIRLRVDARARTARPS